MIRIRPYKNADEEKILPWCSDEDTFERWTAGVLGPYPLTSAQFRKTEDLMRFTAIDEREVCGFFTMRNPKETLDELRIGFVIVAPRKRGCGIGAEMLRQALRYAFTIYRAERVTLAVFEENTAARRCYLAAGFSETGVRETYMLRGKERTAVEMEVRRDWDCTAPPDNTPKYLHT